MSEGGGVAYNDELAQLVIDNSKNSEIVKAQEQSDVNVLSMEAMDEETKKQTIAYLGGNEIPYAIQLYPYDFESKVYLSKYSSILSSLGLTIHEMRRVKVFSALYITAKSVL